MQLMYQNKQKKIKKYIFKSKRKEIKESLMTPSKKKIFKSKIKEIKEIRNDLIINRDEKIKEIKKIVFDQRNNLFKSAKDHYIATRISNAFRSNYI